MAESNFVKAVKDAAGGLPRSTAWYRIKSKSLESQVLWI